MVIRSVLVVDDNPEYLTQIQSIVAAEGLQAIPARSGKEALDKAEEFKPDLIFLDIVMPEMDGYATCRELKSNSTTKDIPIIFVSSKDQDADKIWAKMQGGDGFITKPYSKDAILKHLQ